jgi:hypothetical protein
MAERRMFSKRIVRSAKFLKMPVSSRELYWQLGIEADDDGVVEAFNVMRMTGATEDDLKVLVSKQFVQVLNEDLVTYILDWNENNKLRADRKVDSIYRDLLIQFNPEAKLIEAKPRADTGKKTGESKNDEWTSNGQLMDSIVEVSIVEDKLVEDKLNKNKEKKYFENENINSIFIEFIEVRKKLKAVNSDRAINTLINKLNKYPDDVKYQMIENSIVNSWKDVYELKEKRNSYNNPTRKEIVPDWLNKEVKEETATPEEIAKLNKRLNKHKEGDDWKEEAKKLQQQLSEAYEK